MPHANALGILLPPAFPLSLLEHCCNPHIKTFEDTNQATAYMDINTCISKITHLKEDPELHGMPSG